MKNILACSFLILSAAGLHAQASAWTIDSAHSGSTFQIRHFQVSTVRGMIGNVKGTIMLDEKDITKSSVDATIDATTVNTGVAARDKDLKTPEYFDVAKYPQILFKSTSIKKAGGKLTLIGDLTLNGITKSISMDLDGPSVPQKNAKGVTISGFSASGVILRKDYNFAPNSTPGALGENVKITIDVEIDKQ